VFHVWLPLATTAASTAVAAAPLPGGQRGQGQAVLYVDDDEVMVVMVQRLLQRAGYSVSTCSSAAEALARVKAANPPFAAVVSDFNMPVMSGLELARQLQMLAPGLPVLISSGYLSEDLQAHAGAAGVRALMKKENTLEELAGLLQQVLGSPA
jgi:CheY-like chemotaxis protein